jgi:CubicO group peptidase (beta-lactamase class C family)
MEGDAVHGRGSASLDAELTRLARRSVPGVAAVVIRNGEVENEGSAGLADIRSGALTTPDTVHLWFSMTKIVTATATMQLAESGALHLDAPVREFVPEFPQARAGWPEIRVRHLLSHSSGLANPLPVRWVHPAESHGQDPHDFALRLLRRHGRLRFPAGSKAAYSNLGYIVLGEVIASAGGASYEDYVRAHILEPLSMARTGFRYDPQDQEVATGYQRRLSPMTPLFLAMLPKGIIGERAGRYLALNRFNVDGPAYGGLLGPAREAARFMALHVNDGSVGGVRLLQPESVREMQTIHASGRKLEVGLGWFRRGKDTSGRADHLEHLGGGGGFWNMMRIYPQRRTGVVTMGNATAYDHASLANAVSP